MELSIIHKTIWQTSIFVRSEDESVFVVHSTTINGVLINAFGEPINKHTLMSFHIDAVGAIHT